MGRGITLADHIDHLINKLYLGIICCIFSIILIGSILGGLGLYKLAYVFPLALISVLLSFFLLNQEQEKRKSNSFTINRSRSQSITDTIIYIISILIIILLILIPIIRWPESMAGDWFPWDAGKYHFPKAVEMIRTGSANDLTIAYGEYPFGYESLLAFCLLLTRDAALFGWMHALIDLFFILSFWSLAKRITQFNSSSLLFLVTLLVLSNYFFHFFNLWQVFQPELTTVGKNDLLLTAALLSFLYFYPNPDLEKKRENNFMSVGIVGMIALSIKPNAMYLIVPLWIFLGGIIFYNWVKSGNIEVRSFLTSFIFSSLLMIPGVFWIFRNLIIIKRIFSEYVLEASNWSIAANLTNPYFYKYIPKNLLLILGLAGLTIILSFKRKEFRWKTGILLLLIIGFVFTPVGAFFLRTDVPAEINWRFAETLLAYVFLIILFMAKNLTENIQWKKIIKHKLSYLRIPFTLLAAVALALPRLDVLKAKPENAIILKDQFKESVGVDGYYSAYDYIQKNARNSVVWVENGLPYYAYDPEFTNTVSRHDSADYIVVIKSDWFGGGKMSIPSYFDLDSWDNYYQVVYEDLQGIVYARRK